MTRRHCNLTGGIRKEQGGWVVVLKAENFASEQEARLFSELVRETVISPDFLHKVDVIFGATERKPS